MGRRGGRDAVKRSGARTQPARTRNGRPAKPKVCVFCASRVEWVDYKDVNTLRRLMSDRGKIKARRVTGTCRQHQRDVAIAIKTARELALLPYALTPSAADKPGRGGRGRDGRSGAPTGAPDLPARAEIEEATEGSLEDGDVGAAAPDDEVEASGPEDREVGEGGPDQSLTASRP